MHVEKVSTYDGVIAADTGNAGRRNDAKEVEDAIGLTGYRPVHALLKRERKKALKGVPKQRGRKAAKTLQEYKYENKRLKMEVELLRDFLSLTGKE